MYTLQRHRLQFDADQIAIVAFVAFFCTEFVRLIFLKAFGIFGHEDLGTVAATILIYVPLCVSLKMKYRPLADSLLLYGFILVLFLFTYFAYPEYEYYLTRPTYGFVGRVLRPDRAIYAYLIIRTMPSKETLWKGLKITACILFVYRLYQYLDFAVTGYWLEYNYKGELVELSYSLSYGYSLMLPTSVFILWAIREKKPLCFIPAIILVFCMLSAGNRGALLTLAVFILLLLFIHLDLSKALKLAGIAIVGLAIVSIIGLDNILLWLASVFESLGISSRTLTKLLEGSITDSTGRDQIYQAALAIIREHMWFGVGLFGDRPVLVNLNNAGYCHNLFLELLSNFGILAGGLVILFILWMAVDILILNKDKEWRELYILFFAAGFQLLLSMSFWYVTVFWAGFGIYVSYRKSLKSGVACQ